MLHTHLVNVCSDPAGCQLGAGSDNTSDADSEGSDSGESDVCENLTLLTSSLTAMASSNGKSSAVRAVKAFVKSDRLTNSAFCFVLFGSLSSISTIKP